MAKKILVIDDDPVVVQYLVSLLTDNGYETITASDGLDAHDLMDRDTPDLITLDLEMQREWGPRFFRRMTQHPKFKDIPVIVISGLSRPELAIKKAVATLRKPFDKTELLDIIKKTIG
jgi:CheY-like chemotaxis protein